MKDRAHKLAFLVHVLTIVVLFLKGADKLTNAHVLSGSLFIGLGFLIVALLFLEKYLHWSHTRVKIACMLIESVAWGVVALSFYQDGKVYLPYVIGFSALTYFVLAIINMIRQRGEARHQTKPNL